MRDKSANPDQIIARIAGRQHGMISTQQLNEAGINRKGASRGPKLAAFDGYFRAYTPSGIGAPPKRPG
jgi:hypothetical protein